MFDRHSPVFFSRRDFLGSLAAFSASPLLGAPSASRAPFFQGVNYGFYARNGYFSSPAAQRDVADIAALGAPWVCLIVTVMQETFASTRTFRDFVNTPGDDEVVDIVRAFHDRGVKVMLRPMIECWDGTQRCHLHLPEEHIFEDRPARYRTTWFANYRALTRHYARLAAKTGCEAYGLDSELNPLLPHTDLWLPVIDDLRKTYKGHVTSSFGRTERPEYLPFAQDPNHWIHALDSLGTSMYRPATDKAGSTVDEMTAFLRKEAVPLCRAFAKAYGKPFYHGECGCCSVAGAAKLPWYWANGGGYDGQEQANYMEAVIRAFSAEPWWHGMLWWKWTEQNARPGMRDDPAGDKGFTIRGKPAEAVLRRWCSTCG